MLRRRPAVISNEIRLKRSQHAGSFLVVEGRDDRLFIERYVDDSCNLVVAEGKESVREVVQILDEVEFTGVVGLVDADFDTIEGVSEGSLNIVSTDVHDLEASLLRSPALDRVVGELGSKAKIEAFGREVRDVLLEAATPLGSLRWISRRDGLGLRFSGINYRACVDSATLQLDIWKMIQEIKNRSQRPEIDASELETKIQQVVAAGHDGWHVCSGEDLVAILSVGLRSAVGSNSAQAVAPEVLRRLLRLALDEAEFQRLRICLFVREWEERNSGYRIFRTPEMPTDPAA